MRGAVAGATAAWIVAAAAPCAGQWITPPRSMPTAAYGDWGRNELPVAALAEAWAPVLWFSDHEPLLLGAGGLPSPLPTDPLGVPELGALPNRPGVVYYRATVVRGVSSWPDWLSPSGLGIDPDDVTAAVYDEWPNACPFAPSESDPDPDCLNLPAIELIRLQYLFYFPRDVGGGNHPHDLEIAELWFDVQPLVASGHRIELERVVGYAHGHKGLANKLDVTKGNPREKLVLPLALLIERGKHAPGPDRTLDGEFSPGFDVNQMIADAWGIRDTFGFGWFGSRGYASWMTLGRDSLYQAWPEASAPDRPSTWPYQLRDFKVAATAGTPAEDLLVYLEHHKYDQMPQNGAVYLFTFFENFGAGGRIDLGLGPYLSVMSPQLPYVGGHLVLTGVIGLTFQGYDVWWGGSLLYSPSVAGYFNVYGGITALRCRACTSGNGFGPEAGIKFRIPIPHPPTPDFLGLRVGMRYTSFTDLGHPRLLAEFGVASP
jgi:hypothetical protein